MLCELRLLHTFHSAQFGCISESAVQLLNLRINLSLDVIEELWVNLRLAIKVSPNGFLDYGNYFI